MTRSIRIFRLSLNAVALLVLVAACGNAPEADFYVLQPLDRPAAAVSGDTGLGVRMDPLIFPEYLTRPDIVTRESRNKVELSAKNRWAEPMDKMVARVLTQNLRLLVGEGRILTERSGQLDADMALEVEILSFERTEKAEIELAARYRVYGIDDGEEAFNRHVEIRRQSQDAQLPAIVSAMNAALDDLSGEIATVLMTLYQS